MSHRDLADAVADVTAAPPAVNDSDKAVAAAGAQMLAKAEDAGLPARAPPVGADPGLLAPDREEWLRGTVDLCKSSIAGAGKKRAWLEVTLRGEAAGNPVEVFPGVRGYVVGYGRTVTAKQGGGLKAERLTQVRVCAKTLLAAVERALEALAAGRAQLAEQQAPAVESPACTTPAIPATSPA